MQRTPLSPGFLAFNYLVGAAGLGLLLSLTAVFPGRLAEAGWLLPLTFLLVFIGARFFKFYIPPMITVSLVVPVQCAAIALLGPVLTGWLTVIGFFSEAATAWFTHEVGIPRRVFWSILLFNAGMESLMTLAGGAVYLAVGGQIPATGVELHLDDLLGFAALFLAVKAVNEGLMLPANWLRGNSPAAYWRGARLVLVTEALTIPLALLLMQIHARLPMSSLLLFCGLFLAASLVVQRLDENRKAIERTNRELEKRNRELDALLEIGKAISSDIELERLMDTIHRSCSDILDTSYFFVALYDEESRTLVIEREVIEGQVQPRKILPFGEGLTSMVLSTKRHYLIRDLEAERARIPVQPVFLNEYPTRSWLGMPMIARGEVVGAIVLQNRHPGAFDEEDVRILSSIASQAAIAVKNARLHQEAIERLLIEEENRQLLRLNQKKSEFVNMVAHEFQSPLTSVIGFSNLLMETAREGLTLREARKHLELIHSEARRLSRMVEELLNLSRIRSGRLALTLQDFDVNAVITETIASFTPQIEERQQRVSTRFGAPRVPVHGDSNYIRQVIGNLLSNAIKYCPRGAVITIETAPGEGRALVSVRDSGPGIPADRIDRIFDEFYRSDDPEVHKTKGIGLGLAITRGIVEAHGGRIWCESTPGQGTAFHFTLPLAPAPA